MFLVSDLHLMEINKLKVITHLLFLLDLSLGFQDSNLKCHILLRQLLNLGLLLECLVKDVLSKLLSVILPDATILCT